MAVDLSAHSLTMQSSCLACFLGRISTTDAEADWARYEAECAIWDKEDPNCFYTLSHDEWLASQGKHGLQPAWDDGEVAHWHLDLELSELGRAFLILDELLSSEVIHALFDG